MGETIQINPANFVLLKVKIDGKKVDIDYAEQRPNKKGKASKFDHNVNTVECLPHQDLIDAITSLKESYLRSLRYYDVHDVAVASKDKALKEKITNEQFQLFEDTVITGISVSGKDQLRGAIITGKIKNEVGGYSGIPSPKITLSSDKLGYEKEVDDKYEIIKAEVYKYLFLGKKSQKTLFDEPEKKEKEAAS